MVNSATKSISSFNATNNKSKYGKRLDYSLQRNKDCQKFANDVYVTNEDEYEKKGQGNPFIVIPQIKKGKVLEFHTRDVFKPDYPNLGPVNLEIYEKERKNFDPDLIDETALLSAGPNFPFSLAVKAKDSDDADRWSPSWIFGTNDKEIFGPKLDGKNINPNQYACMGIVDDVCRECHLLCCVSVLWLHHWNLFAPPDRDYLRMKVAVRFDYEENGVKKRFEKNGVKYDSIMDIVRNHYQGDESILWQI